MGYRDMQLQRSAVISDCSRFRYRLGRRWGAGKPLVFVMLNPSVADSEVDDATIRRCMTFALAHGFEAIDVVNLFAYRATDPQDLRRARYPVGPENDEHIAAAAHGAGVVCVAWGSKVAGLERPQIVLPMLRSLGVEPQCLRITRSGHPQHPLMLLSNCRLQPFTPRAIEDAMFGAAA